MTLEPPPLAPQYRDRKTGLVVFGILQILIGALCLLMLMSAALVQLAAKANPEMAVNVTQGSIMQTVATMGGMAVVFVWLGIGSIKARRWARALSLCLGWIGLVSGTIGVLALIWMLPGMDAMMRQGAQQSGQEMPEAMVMVVKVIAVGSALVFYVGIPGALILFYRSRHVRLTCEARDPVPRWTDRCPLPVLGVVLLQAVGAISMLAALTMYGGAFPIFGHMVKGAAAMAIYAAFAALTLYFARGFYLLRRGALWAYIATIAVFGASAAVSFSDGGLMAYYRAAGLPEAQLQQFEQIPMLHSNTLVWAGVAIGVAFIGYLVWLKKFFPAPETK